VIKIANVVCYLILNPHETHVVENMFIVTVVVYIKTVEIREKIFLENCLSLDRADLVIIYKIHPSTKVCLFAKSVDEKGRRPQSLDLGPDGMYLQMVR